MTASVQVRCNSCGGTYYPVQPDGMLYFHTCPRDTPNPRNENVRQAGGLGAVTIMAAGAGVTALGPVAVELPGNRADVA